MQALACSFDLPESRPAGGGRQARAAAAGGRAAGNSKALVSAKLAQETRLLQARNALRVFPAVTMVDV